MSEFGKSTAEVDHDPKVSKVFEYQQSHLPTIWLLGKTGAGKSTLIQYLTNQTQIEIGNGFSACTKSAQVYDFPLDTPIVRFLDTRGLGEIDYDPREDIEVCENHAHLLILVAKAEEVEQGSVLEALKKIRKSKKIKQIMVVHTGIGIESIDAGLRGAYYNQLQFESAWQDKITHVEVDFMLETGEQYQADQLVDTLAKALPIIGLMIQKDEMKSREGQKFVEHRSQVLWYCSGASASDLVPMVGLVSVPSIQAKMLHYLAKQYDIKWDKSAFIDFATALGTSFSVQYGVKLGLRQLIKLLPVYGQTVGSLTAATVSFATTYAIARAACYYFYQSDKGQMVDKDELVALYKQAFIQAKDVVNQR